MAAVRDGDLAVHWSAAADRRGGWWLEVDDTGVSALDHHGEVARVDLLERATRVDVHFWLGRDATGPIGAALAHEAFRHRALDTRQPVAVAVPEREVEVVVAVRAHLDGATTHRTGSTCLVVGRVR